MIRTQLETAVSVISGGLALLTVISPSWIEELTGLEPDDGTGVIEWLFVAAFAAIAVALGLLARRDYLLARARALARAARSDRAPEATTR